MVQKGKILVFRTKKGLFFHNVVISVVMWRVERTRVIEIECALYPRIVPSTPQSPEAVRPVPGGHRSSNNDGQQLLRYFVNIASDISSLWCRVAPIRSFLPARYSIITEQWMKAPPLATPPPPIGYSTTMCCICLPVHTLINYPSH